MMTWSSALIVIINWDTVKIKLLIIEHIPVKTSKIILR